VSNLYSVERVTLTRVTTREGEGTLASPARMVIWYYSDDGERLWRHDAWEENEAVAAKKMAEPATAESESE
jgi:hypothetical protein